MIVVRLRADYLGIWHRMDLGELVTWQRRSGHTAAVHLYYTRGGTLVSSQKGTCTSFAQESPVGVIRGGCLPVMVPKHHTASTASPPPWQSSQGDYTWMVLLESEVMVLLYTIQVA